VEGVRWLLCDARNGPGAASVSFRSRCHGVLGDTPTEQPWRSESTKIINAVRKQGTREEEELDAAQKVIADLHQQNQVLRQQVLTPEKCDRFLTESFRVTEFP
jgi:hypothetical protein